MQHAEAFADNWTYLKLELNWLERVLLNAVARQKKERKEVERLTQSAGDRAASFWWQGLISIEGKGGYDSPPPPSREPSLSYAQQLEARIQATHAQGRWLALPGLRDRLGLTAFEKNLILLGIAPEIHRRYSRLYQYLNGGDREGLTVDLALRLLCRNDQEWRLARSRLALDSPLRAYDLVEIVDQVSRPLLQRSIRLRDALVNYLLADQPHAVDLELLLSGPPQVLPPPLPAPASPAATEFAPHLVLPQALRDRLQQCAQELQFGPQVDAALGQRTGHIALPPGKFVLFVGESGTGKATAAQAIAQAAGAIWLELDGGLTGWQQERWIESLQACQSARGTSQPVVPLVVLLKSAEGWLSRAGTQHPALASIISQLHHQPYCLMILSVRHQPVLSRQWRHWLAEIFDFPRPDLQARRQIWQGMLAAISPLEPDFDGTELAQPALTGGEIVQLARLAAIRAAAGGAKLEMHHIQAAIQAYQQSCQPERPRRGAKPRQS